MIDDYNDFPCDPRWLDDSYVLLFCNGWNVDQKKKKKRDERLSIKMIQIMNQARVMFDLTWHHQESTEKKSKM